MDSAFRRQAPSLSISGGLSSLTDMRIGVASAEAEGGYVLALVSVVSADRRVAVLFRRFITQGHFTTLLAGRGGHMMIRDATGASVGVNGSSFDAPLPLLGGDRLEASFALPSFPLTVSVSMEKSAALAEWRKAILRGSVVLVLFFSLVITLLAYSNRLKFRGFESERLASELALKELLFKEANHRIKNNLTIVQGILYLSASEVEGKGVDVEVLNAAASRVESIALLHDSLSHLPIGEAVMLGEYLGHIVEAVGAASRAGDRVKVETDLQEGLDVDLDVALPCALIVNELITNSLKYAFPDDRSGTLTVSAHRDSRNMIIVRIEDDGVGYDAPKTKRAGSGGLGMQIVELLSDQLGATVQRVSSIGGGCAWALIFSRTISRE